MTLQELHEAFERHADEYLEFHRIVDPRHPRKDICAFLMLHDLAPGERWVTGDKSGFHNMVSWSGHDEICLATDTEALAAAVTDEQVRDLVRCGVRLDTDDDGLRMFV